MRHEEERILENYIAEKGLKRGSQRKGIAEIFLGTEKHLSAEELYALAKKKYPRVSFATVYRALKVLCDCGLCRELRFDDGVSRYEHLYRHEHHDHLICTVCGRFVEVTDNAIERLQMKLFKRCGFIPQRHRLDLYGICDKCGKKTSGS